MHYHTFAAAAALFAASTALPADTLSQHLARACEYAGIYPGAVAQGTCTQMDGICNAGDYSTECDFQEDTSTFQVCQSPSQYACQKEGDPCWVYASTKYLPNITYFAHCSVA
ncbi:hypothetical protein BKA67DRAFT_569941 [Truncatella angustata]|uniref:Uncharacterized protein n=1 Tax=Truncatella angustata TaxID=152316 RepID=A0A9P8UJQ2_9PEZI|nr:uncharacterized protein BKA67DRAFT_569941 [Truncatella angustata]KAH6653500.1 hypothetical protein BKA67DRAFT_569941 [Truncatella angustata]